MKKYILGFVFGAVVFTGANIAFADEKGGKRFNDILETIQYEIDSLRTAIANIQLTPGQQGNPGQDGPQGIQGPAGPQGLQGLKGDTGEQGVPGQQGVQGLVGLTGATGLQGSVGLPGSNGTNGQNLVVRDAKGNRVGLFLGVNPGVNGLDVVPPSWEIWVDSLGATAIYSSFDGSITPSAPQVRVYYSGTSCTGSAYTTTPLPGVVVVGGNSSNSYKTGNRANTSLMSWIRNGNCELTGGVSGGYELMEVDAHLSGPLTVSRE